MIRISFDFELISLEKSFENRPERSLDEEVRKFKESIKDGKIKWTEEEKIELETDQFDTDETLKNTKLHFADMPHFEFDGDLSDFVDDNYKIIGFDESSITRSGTYAKIGCFKFGEGQVTFQNGKYKKKLIMYKPINAYIEDNEHKLTIYRTVIENFIKTIKKDFYKANLKDKVDKLLEWFEDTYKKKIDTHIEAHNFYYPSLGHLIDRIRTADEILKSLIRIKDESNWGKNKKVIFLGDGIQMFRQHIFPPSAFTELFYRFIEIYDIKYYSFSKTCRLRDAQGNFILPIWSEILENKKFLVELPDLSAYTKSKAYITRLQKASAALRFDICDSLDTKDAIYIVKNLIPYSPRGYPLSLIGAHEASTLLASEYNKLEATFLELQFNKKTKKYTQEWRKKVLGE
ncbi:MAG: hypothetical protein ACFFAO_16480 [Candidatus Hermodarchaeota archaeon]